MGLAAGLLLVIVLVAIGGLCYLLVKRIGPFQTGSPASQYLGLDPVASTASSASTAALTPTAPAGAAASAPAAAAAPATPATPLYAVVQGIDMPVDLIAPDPSNPTVRSQPTYGPTGCQAICSSNNACKAASYNSQSQACSMMSNLTPTGIVQNSGTTLMFPVASLPAGATLPQTTYSGGAEILHVTVPLATGCTALCQALPNCTGMTHESIHGNCSVRATLSNSSTDQYSTSWLKNASL